MIYGRDEFSKGELNNIVSLHCRELGKKDLSVVLGVEVIKKFYLMLAHTPHGVLFINKNKEDITSVVCVFNNYSFFTKEFKNSILKYIIFHPWKLVVGLPLILRTIFTSGIVPEEFSNSHLGIIIINSKFSSSREVVLNFRRDIKKSFLYLKEHGHKNVWGSTRDDNRKTVAFLEKNEF